MSLQLEIVFDEQLPCFATAIIPQHIYKPVLHFTETPECVNEGPILPATVLTQQTNKPCLMILPPLPQVISPSNLLDQLHLKLLTNSFQGKQSRVM